MVIKESERNFFPRIQFIEPGSLADKAQIKPEDSILRINGEKPDDFIDYRYLITDELAILELKTGLGKKKVITIEKTIDEGLGIEFYPIKCRICPNRCIFCFIDQNPPGLRTDLYLKDEDYRLSFLSGNYLTLTSLRKKDLKKIKAKRLSPLYISVHSTDMKIRNRMLGNPQAPDIVPILKSLVKNNIFMHTQIVVIPGINDGNHLNSTIEKLSSLYPYVASIAVVPVGLTKHRKDLEKLKPVSGSIAAKLISQIKPIQDQFINSINDPLIYLSDEFYLLADQKFPALEFYGTLDQIENGVGMVPSLLKEFNDFFKENPKFEKNQKYKADIICGTLIYKILIPVIKRFNKIKGLKLNLVPVKNHFYGKSVSVTGLLTASDIIKTLKNIDSKDPLLIPCEMLKFGESLFLDDQTLEQLASVLKRPVKSFFPTIKGLWETIQ